MKKRTPRSRYWDHVGNARKVGTPFLLTFEEWWRIWQDSGHWTERGRRRGQYVMSRPGDQGAYEVGNVVIRRAEENVAEKRPTRLYGAANPNFGSSSWARMDDAGREQMRRKISTSMKGHLISKQTRKRISEARTGSKKFCLPDGSWVWRHPT